MMYKLFFYKFWKEGVYFMLPKNNLRCRKTRGHGPVVWFFYKLFASLQYFHLNVASWYKKKKRSLSDLVWHECQGEPPLNFQLSFTWKYLFFFLVVIIFVIYYETFAIKRRQHSGGMTFACPRFLFPLGNIIHKGPAV